MKYHGPERRALVVGWVRDAVAREAALYRVGGYRVAFIHGVRFVWRLLLAASFEKNAAFYAAKEASNVDKS